MDRKNRTCLYKDISLEVDANFGTEFYLISEDDLQKIQERQGRRVPNGRTFMIYIQLIETKYKGNDVKVARQKNVELDPCLCFLLRKRFQ
jgi:hypothetical protein